VYDGSRPADIQFHQCARQVAPDLQRPAEVHLGDRPRALVPHAAGDRADEEVHAEPRQEERQPPVYYYLHVVVVQPGRSGASDPRRTWVV
jgi:hypothetical protein